MSSFESEMEIIYEQQDIQGIFYNSVFFTVGWIVWSKMASSLV